MHCVDSISTYRFTEFRKARTHHPGVTTYSARPAPLFRENLLSGGVSGRDRLIRAQSGFLRIMEDTGMYSRFGTIFRQSWSGILRSKIRVHSGLVPHPDGRVMI